MTTNLPGLGSLIDHFINVSPSFLSQTSQNNTTHLLHTLGVKSHGTITFGRNQSNKANFIRIPPDASATEVKELMIRRCSDKPPSLVISITGSAKEYGMKSKLFRIFRKGLLKIAQTTDTWIITSGVNTSITKLIGKVIRTNPDPSRSIHLIGIASWGCISGVDQLDVHGVNVTYTKSKNDQKDEVPLEPNHNQFIIVDDGTRHQYEGETKFRARFERAMSGESCSLLNTTINRQRSSWDNLDESVPVVLVVIEGGLDTIKIVHEAVVQNKIPVVLLKGTGSCCDLFAKAYHLYDEYNRKSLTSNDINIDQTNLTEQIKNKLREKLKITDDTIHPTSSNTDENVVTDYFELIYECIEKRKILLNIVNFNAHNLTELDIDLAILQALLNATSDNDPSKTNIEQKHDQLLLALKWNRVDIVKNFILKDDQDWKKIDLNELFEIALVRNQITFVQLFLDHDFPLEDLFYDKDKLLTLYRNENYCLRDDLSDPLRAIYTDIIQPLTGDFFEVDAVFYPDDISHNIQFDDDDPCPCFSQQRNASHRQTNETMHSRNSKVPIDIRIDVDKELFLWSVLTGKQAFALLFWARGKNKICAALIATLLYKIKARKDKDPSSNESADEFQNLAVQILEKFYRTNPCACTKAIIRQIPEFGNVTWLHLAVMAEAKQFIAQRAVQDVLSDIWYGYIDHKVGNKVIVFSTIMLWFSGFLPYHEEMVERTDELPRNHKHHHKPSFIRHDADLARPKHLIKKAAEKVRARTTQDALDEEEGPVKIVKPDCWARTKTGVTQYFTNVFMFLHAPYVKYLYNLYSHMIFLMLFSYVILCDFFPLYEFQSDKCLPGSEGHNYPEIINDQDSTRSLVNMTNSNQNMSSLFKYGLQRRQRPSTSEIILAVWVFTLFCEEIRQILAIELRSTYGKIVAYFSVFWNKLDVLAISLFFIAFILRFLPASRCFCAARILLAIDLSIWYMRTLDMFAAIKRLGPKLVMIGEMVHDLKFFMIMLTVFILAFGVPTYSLTYGVQQFTWHLPRAIINTAYWQIFGELEVLDEIEKNYEISGYVVFILHIGHMTVSSILLINLLIAMFSNTFDRLHLDTDCIWKFQHYSLVCYHLTRPSLPPPFIILSHLWRSTFYFFSHCVHSRWFHVQYIQYKNRSKFKIIADEELTRNIEAIEDALGNEVYYFFSKTDRKPVDRQVDFEEERIHSPQEIVLNKIKTLETQVQTIQNQQANIFEYLECLMNGMKKMGGDDIEMPKRAQIQSDPSCMLGFFWRRQINMQQIMKILS